MGKFNEIPSVAKELYERPDATLNYEGALTFRLDPLMELYIKAASCLVGEPKYYTNARESDSELLKSIRQAAKIDPEFILQLAVYCREKLYLRSVPLVLLAEFANNKDCIGKVPGARKYVTRCMQRADEITELIAYQLQRNKVVPEQRHTKSPLNKRSDKQTVLPNMLKNGIRDAFNRFDAYQFGKYNRQDASVKMRDALFLTHPKAKDAQQQRIFNKIAEGTLESPETWEVMRSTGKMTWHDVINNIFYKGGRVNNYMAILRNLRNCLQNESVTAEDIKLLCKMLSDKNAVLYSKQLPFRFLAAYRTMYDASDANFTPVGNLYTGSIMDAIETAASYSVDNFPKLTGTSTLIACDVSGSMQKEISKRSSIQRYDIGLLLGMIANRFAGHTITGFFGDIFKVVPMTKTSGILANVLEMHKREGEVGYSTNGYLVIRYLLENDIPVDRIMIFTDNQMWDSRGYNETFAEDFIKYQRKYPKVKLYNFDLSGYGTVVLPRNTRGVCNIGGWSDKVFGFIENFEEMSESDSAGNVVIQNIKAIAP